MTFEPGSKKHALSHFPFQTQNHVTWLEEGWGSVSRPTFMGIKANFLRTRGIPITRKK